MSTGTIILYRPVGPKELALITASGYREFPPRLREQPIFYPVLNEEYARQIAREWNVSASGAGYVARFALRADFAVCETYTYTSDAPIDCSISAFGGLQDHEVSPEQLEAWRDQSRASFSLCMFPGDHFFLHTAESLLLKTIARKLQQSALLTVTNLFGD